MSWTKTYYHEEICAMTGEIDEAEYYAAFAGDEPETETATDWRIDAPTGYMEFPCCLCGEMNTVDEVHLECHYREKFWADQFDDDLPF